MRIGINTLFLVPGQVGGTETYLRGLIDGLSKIDNHNEYILFTNRENHDSIKVTASNFSKVQCKFYARNRLYRVFWEQTLFPRLIKKKQIDILHSPGYVSPIKVECKTVVTIPDMQYWYYPQNFPKLRLWYWQYFIPRSAQKADAIITLSDNSKTDIVELLLIPEKKLTVTCPASKYHKSDLYPEIKVTQILRKYNIHSSFILSVGSLLPHKNLDQLIMGYAQLANIIKEQLIIVGLKRQSYAILQEKIKQTNIESNRVMFLGYIPDEDLIALYQKARVFVLPSLFEGFGIPVLEAMMFGCPVVASNRTSIPEVLGDAGLLFDPENLQDMVDSIWKMLSNTEFRDKSIQKGYDRIRLFSWEQMARKTLIVYQDLIGNTEAK
ncbi:MAG: glycosyltransferase family 4 protein [bacterium]